MVRPLLFNSPPSLSSPPLLPPPPPPLLQKSSSTNRPFEVLTLSPKSYNSQKILSVTKALSSTLLSVALSLGFFYGSPLDAISQESYTPQSELNCREDAEFIDDKATGEAVTNEEIVEDAWKIVNESFIDTGRHRWSPDSWLEKKEDILGVSIQSRSRAHEIIKRMLASLGDPYTRFLSPTDFSYSMACVGSVMNKSLPRWQGMI